MSIKNSCGFANKRAFPIEDNLIKIKNLFKMLKDLRKVEGWGQEYGEGFSSCPSEDPKHQ